MSYEWLLEQPVLFNQSRKSQWICYIDLWSSGHIYNVITKTMWSIPGVVCLRSEYSLRYADRSSDASSLSSASFRWRYRHDNSSWRRMRDTVPRRRSISSVKVMNSWKFLWYPKILNGYSETTIYSKHDFANFGIYSQFIANKVDYKPVTLQ